MKGSKYLKSLTAAALLMFSAGTASTPAIAQDQSCRQWARDYCASIGVPGNNQCITYWTMICAQNGGRAGPSPVFKLD